MSQLIWRTSSRSSQTECVEVALTDEVVAVRDSKDRGGGHFSVSRPSWGNFLHRLKNGGYDA
ncbi:DUF397 domain-containing protein [Saccharopolyspora sp.]|uniref:DUF397 domain-containing protein n=1 Tax=Saccharopolyspora sp. TaxID=33915 RepID=UPI0025F0B4AF|nr:DUF397 domain-containing protein [Saccharopolyspora sp.]